MFSHSIVHWLHSNGVPGLQKDKRLGRGAKPSPVENIVEYHMGVFVCFLFNAPQREYTD